MVQAALRYTNYAAYLASDFSSEGNFRLLSSGEIVELPPEDENNIRMAGELEYLLKQVVVPRELVRGGSTELQVHPIGDNRVNRVPDVLVLRPEHIELIAATSKSSVLFDMPAPAFIAEIVSPGREQSDNYRRDYEWKRQQYEWWQIPEYWIVDRHRQKLTALILENNSYVERVYAGTDSIQSAVFPSFSAPVSQLLSGRSL